MYVIGQGHEHLGPGTSLVQRINWTQWQEQQMRQKGMGMLFPEFANDCKAMSATCSEKGISGLGCGCRKECGLGIFETGLDFSGWTIVEWSLVAVGGYVALSTVFTTQRAARRVKTGVKRYRRRRSAPVAP